MAVPQNKEALLAAIDVEFAKFRKTLEELPPDLLHARTMEGHAKGTVMSPFDLLAYLVGWNELVLKWLDRDAAGQPIDFPEAGFKWNALGKLARKFYGDYADIPYPQLVGRLDAAKERIVGIIGRHDDAALYACPWYETWTMGRMIQFNTSSPYANARGRLRKWLKSHAET